MYSIRRIVGLVAMGAGLALLTVIPVHAGQVAPPSVEAHSCFWPASLLSSAQISRPSSIWIDQAWRVAAAGTVDDVQVTPPS